MENKKLGTLMIIISIIFFLFLVYFSNELLKSSAELNCNLGNECKKIGNVLSVTHIGFGFFGFMLALGFYLLFFNKTEKAILDKLESEKTEKIEAIKFDMLLKALDSYEQKVVKIVRDQPGITQNTLRIKLDMSKAKLSYVLQGLEKKGLIKRVEKGKTLQVYLKI